MGFDPCNCSLKIQEFIGTPTPKVGAHLGVWGFIPSQCDALLAFTLGPHLRKPSPWLRAQGQGCKPKARVATIWECEVHSLTLSYTPRNMKCDSHVSLLACSFVSFHFGCKPEARVATSAIIIVVLRIQFLVVQKTQPKYNDESLPFNFKHTYQAYFVYPFSLLFSKTYLKQNVLQIIIFILLCRNEDIPNFIILLNFDFFPLEIGNHFLIDFFLATPSLEFVLMQAPFVIMVLRNVVANRPTPNPLWSQKSKLNQHVHLCLPLFLIFQNYAFSNFLCNFYYSL